MEDRILIFLLLLVAYMALLVYISKGQALVEAAYLKSSRGISSICICIT